MIIFRNLEMDIDQVVSRRGLGRNGRLQKMLDSEVIRLCDPLVPVDSHVMRQSATLATKIGSGVIVYNTPYAQKQYYTNSGRLQQGQRGKLWFERMKAQHKDNLIELLKRGGG